MTTSTKSRTEGQTASQRLADIVRFELERAGGSSVDAAVAIAREVRGDAELFRAVADPLIDDACYDLARSFVRRERKVVWTPPSRVTSEDQTARVNALAQSSLLNFRLPNGVPLGKATQSDVMAAAAFYERQASDMAWKARWLGMIARQLKGRKTVATTLTDATLRAFQEEARNA